MMMYDRCRRCTSAVDVVVATILLLFVPEFCQGKLHCVCTTTECDRDGTLTCQADNFCYVQIIPPVSASVSAGSTVPSSGEFTRGCIDDDTPLLCENKRPSTYRGAWPVLYCCTDHWCNREVTPTLPPWASHVQAEMELPVLPLRTKPSLFDVSASWYRNGADVRSLTAPSVRRQWSMSTRAQTAQDQSLVERRDKDVTLNLLYIGVPVACACVLLFLGVLGILLVRCGRERHAGGQQKSAALLPAYRTSLSSSPLTRQLAVELSHEPCVCLHCNRSTFDRCMPHTA